MIDKSTMTAMTAEAAAPSDVERDEAGQKTERRRVGRVTLVFRTVREFTQLAKRSKRGLWLIPMMGTLALLAILLAFIQVVEYVAPFVYTIF